MQAHIKTYGCTLNQADGAIMESILKQHGIGIASSIDEADVAVINTCTVKRQTAQRILYLLNNLDRAGKRVVVSGCMAGANRALLEKYAPHASILTPSNIPMIAEAVESAFSGKRTVHSRYSKLDRLRFFTAGRGVIARIPISEGCNGSCSFCETRIARGPLNSFSESRILDAIKCSAANGAKEIQLTAQDTGAYGKDSGSSIASLMRSIAALDGDFMVRVGMINPEHLGERLEGFADAMRSDKFYKFVHLPVQSGSDPVLKAMGRRYSAEGFEQQVSALRKAIPGIAIETDMIVGFPSETESDFDRSVDLIRRAKPEVTNISKFSARPNTPASRMRQLADGLVSERSAQMTRAVRAVQRHSNCSLLDADFDALLTEETRRSFNGRNRSYRQIVIRKEDAHSALELGSRCKVRITGASANVLYGTTLG